MQEITDQQNSKCGFFFTFLSMWLKQKEQILVIKIKRQQRNMTQP